MHEFLQRNSQSIPFIIAGFVTGLFASVYATVFRVLAEMSINLFHAEPVIWCILVPLGFYSSYSIILKWSTAAAGSGIPQVMTAIQYRNPSQIAVLDKLLGAKVIVAKVLSSLACVAAGGAIGREGPTIQIGASVFQLVARWMPGNALLDPKKVRNFILAGGASGIAAAFNTPLGGIVFAIEELAAESFREFRSAVLLAVIVAGLTSRWILGNYLYLGNPGMTAPGLFAILTSLLVATIAGLSGGYLGKMIYQLSRIRLRYANRMWVWIGGLSILFIGLAFLSEGKSIGPGTEEINQLLLNDEHSTFITVLSRFFANPLSFLVGGAGGIFAPSLSTGAHMGAWLASLISSSVVQSKLLAVVGMTAFLTGVTRAPLTSAVLVQEMTNQPNVIFSIMIGGVIGHFASQLVESKSYYEKVSEQYAEIWKTG